MIEQPFAGSLVNRLAANETAFALYWLDQAGFVIATPELRILIDPYLSDYLAGKYSHSPYSHARMMPPPVKPDRLDNLNFILCTRRHGDHMDPEGLPFLANQNPKCRVVVPAAELAYAMELGVAESQLVPANADEPITLHSDLRIHPIPAAHEAHKINAAGSHHFDMFGSNTVDPEDIDSAIRAEKEVQVFRAKIGSMLEN